MKKLEGIPWIRKLNAKEPVAEKQDDGIPVAEWGARLQSELIALTKMQLSDMLTAVPK